MSLFSTFALSFGSLLALQAIITAWLFRTASAPLWSKVAVPSLMVAIGCYAPFAVATMLGYPVPVSMAGLPDDPELVAFVPHDGTKLVDLWLISVTDTPRAYETQLTEGMKNTLREAQQALSRGQPVRLKKAGGAKKKGDGAGEGIGQEGKSHAGDRLGIGDDSEMYVLAPAAMSTLPPKE